MSIRVMSAVFECETMTPTQKLVALALADHCHDDGSEARPGMARLRRKTALSERTIQRTLQSLLKDGFLVIQRSSTSNSPYVYRFTMGGVILSGGDSVSPDPRHSDARPLTQLRPNHQEPLLNPEQPSVNSDSVDVKGHVRAIKRTLGA